MKERIHSIIFGTTTRSGKNFDLVLLLLILASVFVVLLESVPSFREEYSDLFFVLEWFFTIVFSLEYILRIAVSKNPIKYIFSWWGMIDLLSIIPSYIGFFAGGYDSIRVIRSLRLLRIFRILQLNRFTSEAQVIAHSLRASYYRIMVFMLFVLMMMILAGTIMYVIEGGENGFDSIPASIYWAIVTTTTVGYGDITPSTDFGKILASMMMIVGYVIIAVPTGLISVEMAKYKPDDDDDNNCPHCEHSNPYGSIYCNQCGKEITE